MKHPDTNGIVHEHYGWDGKCFYDDNERFYDDNERFYDDNERFYDDNERFYDDNEPNKDQDVIGWLRSENAYLRGAIEAYEKFLKDRNAKEDE